MANAWETLLLKSTAPAGSTAWVHHISQAPGGVGPGAAEILHVFPTANYEDEESIAAVTYLENEVDVIHYEAETSVEVLTDEELLSTQQSDTIVYVDP